MKLMEFHKGIETLSEMQCVENAALKLSAYARAIGWRYADGKDPGQYQVAHNDIYELVRRAIKEGPGFYGSGLVEVHHIPSEGTETAVIEIKISLCEFWPANE